MLVFRIVCAVAVSLAVIWVLSQPEAAALMRSQPQMGVLAPVAGIYVGAFNLAVRQGWGLVVALANGVWAGILSIAAAGVLYTAVEMARAVGAGEISSLGSFFERFGDTVDSLFAALGDATLLTLALAATAGGRLGDRVDPLGAGAGRGAGVSGQTDRSPRPRDRPVLHRSSNRSAGARHPAPGCVDPRRSRGWARQGRSAEVRRMTALFFFGTLRDRELLEIVLDRPVAADELRPARADGYAARWLAGQDYPHLVEEPGAVAEGVVFIARPAELDRLDYFEEAEYGLTPIRVETDAGPVEARYYRSTGKVGAGEGHLGIRRMAARGTRGRHRGGARADGTLWQPARRGDRRHLGRHHDPRADACARRRRGPPAGRLRRAHGPEDVESWRSSGLTLPSLHWKSTGCAIGCSTVAGPTRFSRTVVCVGDAVTVVPYDARRDAVLLIEQFRPAMFARGDRCPWGVEAVAGRIDREMDAETAARREAREEAGIALGRVETVAAYYATPGYAAEQITSLVGEADLGGAGGLFGLAHENEDIRAFIVPLDEALAG